MADDDPCGNLLRRDAPNLNSCSDLRSAVSIAVGKQDPQSAFIEHPRNVGKRGQVSWPPC